MEIHGAEINWYFGWANSPRLHVYVDEMPRRDEFIFETIKVGDHEIIFGEKDGVVMYNVHDPRNERGYGGAVFKYTLKDGSVIERKGPWSSNSMAMNSYFPDKKSIEVLITCFKTGYTVSGCILVSLAEEVMMKYFPDVPTRFVDNEYIIEKDEVKQGKCEAVLDEINEMRVAKVSIHLSGHRFIEMVDVNMDRYTLINDRYSVYM